MSKTFARNIKYVHFMFTLLIGANRGSDSSVISTSGAEMRSHRSLKSPNVPSARMRCSLRHLPVAATKTLGKSKVNQVAEQNRAIVHYFGHDVTRDFIHSRVIIVQLPRGSVVLCTFLSNPLTTCTVGLLSRIFALDFLLHRSFR